jgi:hypothetical protein
MATRRDRAVSRDNIRTVHLGQFTHEHAEEIAGELEGAGIAWWFKAPGYLSQIWEHGVRLFVDRERLEEARAIADRILAGDAGRSEAGGREGPSRGEGPSVGEDHPEGEGSSSGQA